MADLKSFIRAEIAGIVGRQVRPTAFRPPLVGFAAADDPWFPRLKELVAPDHLLPADLLPGARTVVSFFLPFTRDLVRRNQAGPLAAPGWAIAQKEADEVIDAVVQGLGAALARLGIGCSGNPEAAPYDPARLLQLWSQRHVAYLCGLGTFGLNQLIITRRGCAGRLGSVCVAAPVAPDPIAGEEYCPHKVDGSCGACVRRCPAGALGPGSFDRWTCDAWITEYTRRFFAGRGAYRACGKCVTLPCALERPRRHAG